MAFGIAQLMLMLLIVKPYTDPDYPPWCIAPLMEEIWSYREARNMQLSLIKKKRNMQLSSGLVQRLISVQWLMVNVNFG